ncbi:MAG: hypothetical protein OXD29_02865 [Roseovarius sp.]|nr:hypothetical protein [Roseovarius sp.]MCY4206876.1 hypothetical protein [Roseovarius sp.]MCY4292676.1 hypothetical protein [Roseovarius sp.]MCY4315099.1 hypothetical protein [Roseovarius sp.]
MKLGYAFAVAALIIGSAVSAFACPMQHNAKQAMSCAEGTVWDGEAQACVPQQSS